MAKGNLFLGYGSGAVGDIVLSRLDGELISRARNRRPRNPRTNKQLYTRAIMASVMATYAAGKEIFDHSFEGFSVGAENQRRFMSENIRLLRTAIANAIEAGDPDATGPNVTAPGVQVPVFNLWKISEGTYPMVAFAENATEGVLGWELPSIETGETPAAYAARVGLVADDLFTFLVFKPNTSVLLYRANTISYGPDRLFQVAFGFVRLRVKPDLATTGVVSVLGDLFTAELSANIQSSLLEEPIDTLIDRSSFIVGGVTGNSGMIGLIRSREDEDLRSNSFMRYDYPGSPVNHGLDYTLLLWAWKNAAQKIGQSELILEGGDF